MPLLSVSLSISNNWKNSCTFLYLFVTALYLLCHYQWNVVFQDKDSQFICALDPVLSCCQEYYPVIFPSLTSVIFPSLLALRACEHENLFFMSSLATTTPVCFSLQQNTLKRLLICTLSPFLLSPSQWLHYKLPVLISLSLLVASGTVSSNAFSLGFYATKPASMFSSYLSSGSFLVSFVFSVTSLTFVGVAESLVLGPLFYFLNTLSILALNK